MLFSLQFIALLSRLLNVRQSKPLVGLAKSGEFFAEMVGGPFYCPLTTSDVIRRFIIGRSRLCNGCYRGHPLNQTTI